MRAIVASLIMFPARFVAPCQIAHGADRIDQLETDVAGLIGSKARAVVICDRGIAAAGLAERARRSLGNRSRDCVVIEDIAPHAASIERATADLRELGPICIIGIGGGGVLDSAKLIAATLAADQPLEAYALLRHPFPKKSVPTVLIPTTSGTGSEVTRTAIFAAHDGRKLWAWGDAVLADVAILDPTLCIALPPVLTAATGLDALIHAIEACTVKRRTPTTSAWGYDAIRRIMRALPQALNRRSDINARLEMQIAACVAGACIENCGTGIAHALGHALESTCGLHHGRAVTLALAAAITWNAHTNEDVYAPIAKALGGSGLAAVALSNFIDEVGLDRRLDANPDKAAEIVETTFAPENAPMRANNPRRATRSVVRGFVAQIVGGGS